MHAHTDIDAFRAALADAVDGGDPATVAAMIRPAGRVLAAEHGGVFRELIAGLPPEIWHNDPQIAAQLGGSYRSNGSPRGNAALGYFRAAEDALALTPHAPAHCLASVLLGHAAALRSLGCLVEARAKVMEAHEIISTRLSDVPIIRIELGARFSLENGMLDLEEGSFESARAHLEYAHGHAATHLTRAEHVEMLGAVALADAIKGDLQHASTKILYAKELAEGSDLMQTGYGAPALVAEVMVSNERFDIATSSARESDMLEAASRNEWEPFALAIAAHLKALQGDFIESLDLIERSLQGYAAWDGSGYGADFARLLRAALLLAVDQADESWAILQTLEPGENHSLCPARIIAQLRMMHGDLLGADEAIHDCETLGGMHCSRTVVDVQLIRAAIELARGNASGSDLSADRAFATMARTGSRAGLQRVGAASLSTLAGRAAERSHNAAVSALLAAILERDTADERPVEPLSARERLVLAQVQRGLTVSAIAGELYISPNTVKTHLRRLYRKLNVSTRDEAIRAARSLGLDREITRDSPASPTDSPESAVL